MSQEKISDEDEGILGAHQSDLATGIRSAREGPHDAAVLFLSTRHKSQLPNFAVDRPLVPGQRPATLALAARRYDSTAPYAQHGNYLLRYPTRIDSRKQFPSL